MNPLVPGVGDVLWASAAMVNAVLVLVALVVLMRAADKRRWPWTVLLIVFVPFIGPILAIIERRKRTPEPTRSPDRRAVSTA